MPTRYAPNKSFDPELANAMSEAFTAAWESVKLNASPDMMNGNADWARETLAMRIIDRAQAGECDVKRLHLDAVAHLANAKIEKRA